MTSPLPVLLVEMAFSGNPFDAAPTFTALSTAQAVKFNTTTGRQQATNAFQAGTASITFSDPNRELDPLNSSGPHYGSLLPNKRIRIKATPPGGSTYTVFDGYVTNWPVQYDSNFAAYVTVQVADAFKLLSRMTLPDCPYVAAVLADAPRGYYRLGEASGLSVTDSSGNSHHGTYYADKAKFNASAIVYGSNAGALSLPGDSSLQMATIPTGGGVTGNDWSIEFWASGYFTGPGGTHPNLFNPWLGDFEQVSFFYMSAGVVGISFFGCNYRWQTLTFLDDGLTHHWVFSAEAGVLKVYRDNFDITSQGAITGAGGTSSVDTGGVIQGGFIDPTATNITISDLALHSSHLSAARIAAHYTAGTNPRAGDTTGGRVNYVLGLVNWPGARSNVDTGLSHLGAAKWGANTKALAYLQTIEATEQGELYVDQVNAGKIRFADRQTLLGGTNATTTQATYKDANSADSGTLRYSAPLNIDYNDQLVYNNVTVNYDGGAVTVSDSTSQTTYGPLATSITTIHPSAIPARSIGQWTLSRYKDAKPRIGALNLDPVGLSTLWVEALGRDIGDLINVQFQPRGVGGASSYLNIIEGIGHSVDIPAGTWKTTFWMRPSNPQTYWTLGTSQLGSTTILAP